MQSICTLKNVGLENLPITRSIYTFKYMGLENLLLRGICTFSVWGLNAEYMHFKCVGLEHLPISRSICTLIVWG